VEDEVGGESFHRVAHGGPVDQVQRVDVGGQDLERPVLHRGEHRPFEPVGGEAAVGHGPGQHVADVPAELTVTAGDEYPLWPAHLPASPDSGWRPSSRPKI